MTMIRALAPLLLLFLVIVAPEAAEAQRSQQPPESREHLERRVRDRFEALIRKELDVDETTAARLRATVEEFTPERRELARRQGELRRTMRRLDDVLPPAEAQAVLDDLVDLQRAEVDLIVRERTALLRFLSPGQVLRFYALRDQLGDRVRDVRNRPDGRSSGETPP